MKEIKSKIKSFYHSENNIQEIDIKKDSEYQEMQNSRNSVLVQIEDLRKKENILEETISDLKIKEDKDQFDIRDKERLLYELMKEKMKWFQIFVLWNLEKKSCSL